MGSLCLSFLFLLSSLLLLPSLIASSSSLADPQAVVDEVHRSVNSSRRNLGYLSCGTGNPIDDCWRCDPNWEKNRQRLADCAIGFGKNAVGGRDGKIYVVTDSGDDDPVNPKPGTLRHAVVQTEPLWIIFARDMVIQLKEELIMNSFKTIDGRGASVHIAGGPCITIQYVTNIIIHGIHIHDCKQGGNAMVRSSPSHYGWRTISDGDGVSIFGGSHVWVDHCSLSNCKDGLIDAIMGSTAITISNNFMTHHDKVMLLGHSDSYVQDKNMQVTIAFNHFGEGLVQRMPRCRHGYFHVVNNDYTHWEMYAIGGSASPTINSQGNRFLAPDIRFSKDYKAMVERESGYRLKYIRSDNGGEYTSYQFRKYYKDLGIQQQLAVSYTPEQNGVSERKNRTVMEMARCMLAEKKMPKYFWAEAFNTAVYLLNRLPTRAVQGHDAIRSMEGYKNICTTLEGIWLCYAYVPDAKRGKLDSKAELCILLGYSTVAKRYKVYNVSSKKVFVRRDLVVDESRHYDWDRNTIVKKQGESTPIATLNLQKHDASSSPNAGIGHNSDADMTSDSLILKTRSLAEVYEQCNFA